MRRARCASSTLRDVRVGLLLYAGAFGLLAFASIAGLVALVALVIGTVVLCTRGGDATCFLVGIGFAFLTAAGFAGFVYLERLLTFDVGRFG